MFFKINKIINPEEALIKENINNNQIKYLFNIFKVFQNDKFVL